MSSQSIFANSPQGYLDVHGASPKVRKLLENAGKLLPPVEEARMKAELGRALLHSIAANDSTYVNHVVEGWVRTLYFKAIGLDEVLDAQEDPIAAGEEPIDLNERRTRLR